MSRRSAAYSSTRSPSPHVSTSGKERSRSPLSPTRISRIQEKEELKNLNDRLATYIDTVRRLESENSRLTMTVRTQQESMTREVTDIKNVYEKELTDVRRALDETAKEKAKLQLAVDKWTNEVDELSTKLSKKEKESSTFEKQLKSSEIHNQDLQRRLTQTLSENRRLENALKEAQTERDKLSQQVQLLKKELDNEKLLRVDLENKFQTVKEELMFKDVLHKKEITETRKMKETEVSEINTQLKENYEQRLADTLRELREQYETQMRMNRDEIETIYETKIADLQNKLERSSSSAMSNREELRSLKSKVESLVSRNANLENQASSLQNRIRDLEKMLEQERDWHSEALSRKDDELRKLQEDIAKQLSEYQDLLDIKVGLDLEINAYRKLLEGEESRLNMSPCSSRASSPQPSRSTPMRSTKRRRTVLTETERTSSGVQSSGRAKGDVEISDQDLNGKYVKIHNKGTSEVSLGNWQLVQHGIDTEVKYKFPRATIIKPNATLTVWSSDSGMTHYPPQNYVMKNQAWISSPSISTALLNTSGDEVATRESLRVSESSEIFHSEEQ